MYNVCRCIYEVAFDDALASNDSAVQAMGDGKLKVAAAELITQVKKSVTIDWPLRLKRPGEDQGVAEPHRTTISSSHPELSEVMIEMLVH